MANLITDVPNYSGSFGIDSATSQGDVYVQVLDAPIGHKLDVRSVIAAESLGKRNTLLLPPTFEGNFEMKAPPFPFRRIVDTKKDDPTGRNRTRTVLREQQGLLVENGTIAWEGRELRERGHVQLRASLGQSIIVI